VPSVFGFGLSTPKTPICYPSPLLFTYPKLPLGRPTPLIVFSFYFSSSVLLQPFPVNPDSSAHSQPFPPLTAPVPASIEQVVHFPRSFPPTAQKRPTWFFTPVYVPSISPHPPVLYVHSARAYGTSQAFYFYPFFFFSKIRRRCPCANGTCCLYPTPRHLVAAETAWPLLTPVPINVVPGPCFSLFPSF